MSPTMEKLPPSLHRGEPPHSSRSIVASDTSTLSDGTPLKLNFDTRMEDPRRRYGLNQLLRFMGFRHVESHSPDGALYYGDDVLLGRRAAVWIRADRCWSERFESMPGHDRTEAQEDPRLDGHCIKVDLARAVFAHLTLEDERASTDRDAHGRVNGRGNPLTANDVQSRSPIQSYIEMLNEALGKRGLRPESRPRWPRGARYAACLTHDVDDPETPRAMRGLVRAFLTPGNKSRRADYWRMRAEVRTRGLYNACFAPANRRREWDFPHICELERRFGFRSAFYFAVVNRREGHPCDVEYEVARPRYRRLFSTLSSGGWEVGLHAVYATKDTAAGIAPQVQKLNSLTQDSARGVRHHYLQVDHENPDRSLIDHANAGLLYDSSIGFNDCPGFRAGTALPYQPFDEARRAARDFVELPLSIADMHLPKDDAEKAVGMVIDHLRLVRTLGGLAVLDWHVGHWHTIPAWRAAYVSACETLAADGAFVATPREIAEWWLRGT